jgi:hypothetical protein
MIHDIVLLCRQSRIFDGPSVATWTGFSERIDDQKARHTKFQFAVPEVPPAVPHVMHLSNQAGIRSLMSPFLMVQRAGPPPQTSAEWHARSGKDGEITVEFQYSKLVPRKARSSESGSKLDSQPEEERPAVPEWKKWWQVPGVTTAAVQAVIQKMPRCISSQSCIHTPGRCLMVTEPDLVHAGAGSQL